MTSARILYLARYRVPHAIMSLQPEFANNLIGVDRTCIASPVPQEELWPVFEKYGIDTSTLDYAPDSEIYRLYPEVNNWVFEGDYRTYWLRQQAIKFAFLDYLNYDLMIMHDCDCLLIQPYEPIKDGVLNFQVLENERHSWGYYESIRNGLGFERLTPHCFISENVPVLKQDFKDLTKFLEQRHQKKWLDAMIDSCPPEPTVPPWGNGELIRWFSEYEFIGNWTMSRRPITMEFQRRYHYDDMEKIDGFDPRYHTAVCDAVPDLRFSLQMDWDRKEVVKFDYYMDRIRSRLIQQLETDLPQVEKSVYWVEPSDRESQHFKLREQQVRAQNVE